MPRTIAPPPVLTGPFAARLLDLDGFRDLDWVPQLCLPVGFRSEPGVLRTRRWLPPIRVGDVEVAHPAIVLRHLANDHDALHRAVGIDGIDPIDRVEFGAEHALRAGLADIEQLRIPGSSAPGDRAIHAVLNRRGLVPPTESFAETSAVQSFRRKGWDPWRQVPIIGANGRIVHRGDFALAFHPMPRPRILLPQHGLIIEIDGRTYHEDSFEADHARQTTYDELGFHWVTFSAHQVLHRPDQMLRAIESGLRRAGVRPNRPRLTSSARSH